VFLQPQPVPRGNKSLIKNFTHIIQQMWEIQSEIPLRPEVKCEFHNTNRHDAHRQKILVHISHPEQYPNRRKNLENGARNSRLTKSTHNAYGCFLYVSLSNATSLAVVISYPLPPASSYRERLARPPQHYTYLTFYNILPAQVLHIFPVPITTFQRWPAT
jgi:hypothetical protein